MALKWTRTRDGEHYGKPTYEYNATGKDGVEYHIVWAYDRGGTFGYTARHNGEYLSPGYGICWARALHRCKDACERIESRRPAPVTLAPNWAGEFTTFEDWVNNATRKIANKTCETSGCTVPVPPMCVDTKGRRCFQGGDFMRARDDGSFPVRYFWDCKLEA